MYKELFSTAVAEIRYGLIYFVTKPKGKGGWYHHLPKDAIINLAWVGNAFGFFVFFDVVLICVDSFKFLSKAYEHFHSLVLNIPFHFYFPSIKPNELLIALSTTLSSFCAFRHTSCAYFLQEAFMNSQEELVNHTKVERDSMTWVPSSTSNTYELYNLNI